MSTEMFREISKCFGTNPLEEVISARRDDFFETVLCIRQFMPTVT